jgi:hypothetical protein
MPSDGGNGKCGRWAMTGRETEMKEEGFGLVRKPARRVMPEQVVREATTGRVVSVMAEAAVGPQFVLLPRVWAVAEGATVETPVEEAGGWKGGLALVPDPVEEPEDGHEGAWPVERAGPDACADMRAQPDAEAGQRGELAFYRKYTEAMLRRYFRLSISAGRVPSLLGRELFRGNVTSCKVASFEDVVVFCFDMEKLLGRLRPMDQRLIKRIAIQEYTQVETASMLRMSLRQCRREYGEAVNRMTEMLLEAGMLEPQKCCQ